MTCRPLLALFRPLAGLGLAMLVAVAGLGPAVAQPAPTQTSAAPAAVSADSGWRKLNPAQKRALAPLSATWDSLSPAQQRKWLEISRNFPSLGAQEQAKMHERMSEWVALSPKERAQARLNFGKTAEIARELTPAEKMAKWQAYQALSPEERQKLAEGGKTRPLGAAPAVKPVPAERLAVVPPTAPLKPAKPAEAASEGGSASN